MIKKTSIKFILFFSFIIMQVCNWMDLDKYLNVYTNVTREELEKIIECVCDGKDRDWCERAIDWHAGSLQESREKEILHGRPGVNVGPIVHVLSVSVQSKEEGKPFAIYGRIGVVFPDFIYGRVIDHEVYKYECCTPQILDTTGALMLNGPRYSCDPLHAYIPLFRNRINVKLFDEVGNVFASENFTLGDTICDNDFEEVKFEVINCEQGSLKIQYITIPLGVYCHVAVTFSRRKKSENCGFININGKIGGRYDNTYGNYALEETILFEKQNHEYERVVFGQEMQLGRYWLALPAYSSLFIQLDFSEFRTGQKIINNTMEFLVQGEWMSCDTFALNDFFIEVSVAWFTPSPMGPQFEKVCFLLFLFLYLLFFPSYIPP